VPRKADRKKKKKKKKKEKPATTTEPSGGDMAALAAHHHRHSFSSVAAPTPTLRRRHRFSSLPFSARPSSHGSFSSRAATRVLTRAGPPAATTASSLSLEELRRGCSTWTWRGMRVNYLARGQGLPVLLVHGFGASVAHWRR